jgi:lipoyl(octanoyl) transferase
MRDWRLISSPGLSGAANMELDLKLFHDFERGRIPSTLRIYSWQPRCVSHGYAQKLEEEIDVQRAARLGYDVVGRPTGGGIVFHNEAEVTYSLVTALDNPLLPKGLVPSYKKISEAIVHGLVKTVGVKASVKAVRTNNKPARDTLCFSYPAEYEIVVEERKLAGSAQKRGQRALLQQGSIFVRQPEEPVFSVLKKPCAGHNAVSLEELLGRPVSFNELKEALVVGFREGLGVKLQAS